MSFANVTGSALGTSLQKLLMCDEIVPGSSASYQTCKVIYSYHPLGKKLVDRPISMAQSQRREIAIPAGPESRLKEAFDEEWKSLKADEHIANAARLARMYGVGSLAMIVVGEDPAGPVDFEKLAGRAIAFSEFDPLNTAGSLVLNQDPNAPDFQKSSGIAVSGIGYHRSRTVTMFNESPLYIDYTVSGFGYVGRSVFQRALFPLKTFVQTLVTDDLVVRKSGVLVAMLKAAGSVVNNLMARFAGQKRQLLKEAETNNVLSIDETEKIESLDLKNLEGPYALARKNAIENVATAADMPAKIINSETFAEGFGEGTEDAKDVARYVDGIRTWLDPLYEFFERVARHRAWNRDFYATIQKDFPEYASTPYETAFWRWSNSFVAAWPNLLTEPDSEKVKKDDVKLKAVIAAVEVFGPMVDPENKATLLKWAADNMNENKLLFPNPLILDFDALAAYAPPKPVEEPSEPKPFSAADALTSSVASYLGEVEGNRVRRIEHRRATNA